MKKKVLYLFSFLSPIFVFFIYCFIMSVFCKEKNIFSSNRLLIADLKDQYLSLFEYLKNVFDGKESIFYSFSNYLGGNMIGNFYYYLSSPLNILLLFFSSSNILNGINLLILIKIGLSGFTMYIFLMSKKNNNTFFALLFSLFYALMGYNVSYYFNLMWLDVVYFSPLVLMGIDRIIYFKKSNLYIITLSLSIFSNFYIAYMLFIFCFIYFFYEFNIFNSFNKHYSKKSVLKMFLIDNVFVILICFVVLFPVLFNLSNILRCSVGLSIYSNGNIFSQFFCFISKLFILPNDYDNVTNPFLPNVYFGIICLYFFISFFINCNSIKEKKITYLVIIIFILSFCFNFFNLVWHGFSFPNGYAYRFSFLFSLFSILISYKSVCKKYILSNKQFLIFILVVFSLGLIIIFINCNQNFHFKNVFLSILFLFIYHILIRFKDRTLKFFTIFFICIFELLLLFYNCFRFNIFFVNYERKNSHCEFLDSDVDINYRVDSVGTFSALESFTCNDSRISGNISFVNSSITNFLYKTGFRTRYSSSFNNNNTPAILSLLSVKKYINNDKENNIGKIDSFYYLNLDYYLHENNTALPLGFISYNNELETYTNKNDNNVFDYQNNFIKLLSGLNKDVLIPYELKQINKNTFEVTINNDYDSYIYIKYPLRENYTIFGDVYINDYHLSYGTMFDGVFKVNNYVKNNDKLLITINLNEKIYGKILNLNEYLFVYYFDNNIFNEHYKILNQNTLNITKREKNVLEGNFNSDNDGMLFLSIPYEKGWNIYIDNKKVNYKKIYNTFIGVVIKKGKHTLKMKFYPEGFNCGFLVSIISSFLLIIFKVKFFKNKI